MENMGFDEDMWLIQDKGYGNCTPDASRIDAETSFREPATTEATWILHLRQKLKRYRYLGVTGNPGLADLDQFNIKNFKSR